MTKYNWKASFILNGAKSVGKIELGGWEIEEITPKGKKSRVKLTRRFTRTNFQEYWDVYSSAEEEASDFLNAMSISHFTVETAYFPTISDFELVLENIEELKRAGESTPSHGTFGFTYNLKLKKSGINAVFNRVGDIESSASKDLIKHCLTIFRRGLSYEDEFEKFFTIWRAFNAIYNHISSRNGERNRIEDALQQLTHGDVTNLIQEYSNITWNSELELILVNNGKSIFNYLASKNIVNDFGVNYSQSLSNAISDGNQEQIIKNAILYIYVVRCKYVHGSDSSISKEKKLFTICSAFLSPVLILILYKIM